MDREMMMQIEWAALNAWPASRQMMYDGWLLRFTGGASKRVNSVNVLGESSFPLLEKIAHCEEAYARQGLPVIYRLPEPFSSAALRESLVGLGYVEYDPTYVLGRDIDASDDLPNGITLRFLSIPDWLQVRSLISGTPLVGLVHHAIVLNLIVPEKALIGLYVDDRPVACGMGVLEGELLGYFSIYTRRSARRNGYGRAVMAALSRWGGERGAKFGYLQVEGDNKPALGLYERLGFELCYSYVYSKLVKANQ